MTKRICFWCWVWLCWTGIAGQAAAQDMPRVRQTIEKLCSKAFFGRGYVQEGDRKAARYLQKQFDDIGLKAFEAHTKPRYLHPFVHDVNTFGGKVSLRIDGKDLALGEDFIIEAPSGAGKGQGQIVWIDSASWADPAQHQALVQADWRGKILATREQWQVYWSRLPRPLLQKLWTEPAAQLLITERLVHSISSQQAPLPRYIVRRQAWPTQPSQADFEVEAAIQRQYESYNVVGYVPGTAQPDSFWVFTAHYDHLGGMGDVYFPGANDNASGVAMLLELARHYAQQPHRYSMVFIAFGAEEAGLIGSGHFVKEPAMPLQQIRFLFNLDLLGTGEEGGTVVNGKVHKEEFERLKAINERLGLLPKLVARDRAANSDHHFFSEKGVPAFFLYLMGQWPQYHDIHDRPPLPLGKFKETFILLTEYANSF